MAQYKVVVLRVQGINKITYKAGDIVEDNNFPQGVAAELVKGGYLVAVDAPKEDAPKGKPGKGKSIDQPADASKDDAGKVDETVNPV